MKQLITLVTLLALLSIACQAAVPPTPTVIATKPPAVIVSSFTPEPTQIVVEPTVTQAPAFTPTLMGEIYAWNNIAEIDSGGVKIQIARLVLGDKLAVDQPFSQVSTFDDRPVVAAIIFIIQNTSTKTAMVYPDQGKVVAGGEQVDLTEFMLFGTFGDDLGGDIFPGVTKIGGIWLGFKRTPVQDIQNMLISINAPLDENFNTIGGDYRFDIDLSERKNDSLQDSLKSLR